MSLLQMLSLGLAAMGLDASEPVRTKLLSYLALLKKWNQTYNLTAVRDEHEMVTQHLLDSLSILPVLSSMSIALPGRWADVGSGAGLPGIPLAIVRPDLEFSLIEAVDKKSAFQRQAKIELGLANVSVVSSRAEKVSSATFDVAISRAFAELAEFIRVSGHLIGSRGRLYAMKGVFPEDEIRCLPSGWRVENCLRLEVPGLGAQRHLIVLEKV